MRIVKPINVTSDGCAFTVRARYDGACLKSLTGGGGFFPNTGVVEIIEDDKVDTDRESLWGDGRLIRGEYL